MSKTDPWQQRKQPTPIRTEGDHRSVYQRDKARILHSAAFRRLQAKTQVLGVGMSDFYRTRLTHSLEASQIGQGIAAQIWNKYPELSQQLALDEHLIEAICLAHDIGHPPYGHGGEVALHYMMHNHGGFEGNGQTFRIISKLEPYTQAFGMNLTRRTILGLVKYPSYIDNLYASPIDKHKHEPHPRANRGIKANDWHPPKGLYLCDKDMFDWLSEPLSENDKLLLAKSQTSNSGHNRTLYKSFDCSIMELADDIAYAIHDLEDAIVMGIINQQQFIDEVVSPIRQLPNFWLTDKILPLSDKLFSPHHYERKDAIGALVNCFITAIDIKSTELEFDLPLLRYNANLPKEYDLALNEFKRFVFRRVIRKPEIQLLEYKGQQIVMELFEAFASDPERLLPENKRSRWRDEQQKNNGMRVICDYISSMTDEFAARLYTNLFMPKSGSVHDNHGQ